MMKKNIYRLQVVFLLVAGLLSATSCNDWLDVKPKTEEEAEELFSTIDGFKSALGFGRIPAKRNAGARRIFFGKRSGGDRSGSCGDHRAGAFCFEIKIIKNPFRKPAERTCRFLKRDFYHVLESELRFYLFSVFFLRVTLKTNVRNRKPMIIQVTNTVVLCLLNIS